MNIDIRRSTAHERPPCRPRSPKKRSGRKPKRKKRKHDGKKPARTKKEGAKARNLKDATKLDHDLRSNHPVHALKIGSLKANIARRTSAVLTDAQQEAVASRLRTACVLLQRLRRHAFWACAVQMDRILRREGTPESRKADLDEILDGDSFAKTLATLLLSGKVGSNSAYMRAMKNGEEVKKPLSLETFSHFTESSGIGAIKEMPLTLDDVPGADPSTFVLTRASELAMVQVQSALRSHFRNAQFEVENKDPSMSAVEFFFIRNSIEKKYKDFPQAHFAPRFSFFSEHAMVDVLWGDDVTRGALRVVLGLDENAGKRTVEETVQNRKGLLISKIFYDTNAKDRLSGYHNKLSLQDGIADTRYKLRGTICTDGLVLNLLAYDTHQKKHKSKDSKSSDDMDLETDTDWSLELDDAFLDEAYDGESDDSEPQDVTASDLAYINWKRGSDLLPNVEVTFAEKKDCPAADKTIVVGCDPGIKNAMTFSKLDPLQPNRRETFKVTSNFLNMPVTKFRHLLQRRKDDHGITRLESQLPSFRRDNMDEFFRYITERPDGCVESRLSQLMRFYEHRWNLKKGWDVKKAQTATYDYVIQRLLRMMRGQEDQQSVLSVGLGSFTSTIGMPSKHTNIMKHVVVRIKSLGYPVVGTHEYFTSARCPRPACSNFLETILPRSKYCRNCKVYLDRDAVGSENIAWICKAQIADQYRPAKFKPEIAMEAQRKRRRMQ